MRLLIVLALAGLLSWGVWSFFGDQGEPAPTRPEAPRPTPPAHADPTTHAIPTTVTLVVTVQTEAGSVPQKTRAGYRVGGEARLRTVDAQGRVMFTDAPTGPVTLVARAPGYEDVLQQRYLTGGLRTDALLQLKPRKNPKKR